MTEVVVLDGARTPIGTFGGSLRETNAPTLLEHAFRAALDKTKIDPKEIDETIVGQVFQGSDAPDIARYCSLRVGIPKQVPGIAINRQCASGLEAAVWGTKSILTGESSLVLTGGVESMSTVPYHVRGMRWGVKMGPQFLIDGMAELLDDPSAGGMWIWAENMATKFDVSREEQDKWSLVSHQRAIAATLAGRMREEIAPIELQEKKGVRIMDKDEGPRADTSLEKLARLEPKWQWDGSVTPGNSSTMNDGASAVFVASREKADALGIKPLAKIISWAIVGIDPEITGYAPVVAIPAALKKAGLAQNDIALFEINEAFAVMIIPALRELNIDPEKLNVNGGGIALGHPVGMSGNRLLLTMAYELKHRQQEFGAISLCAGGGQGIAMIIQNI
ncbi:MAG: thiolase family protein [Chloroflexi bacterium]|nr:thiolase family protein [Chloroflexota bacterium]